MRGPRSFIFNNQSSADLGLIIKSIDRPILPASRSRKTVVPGKDGAWDFGFTSFEEITITINCTIPDPLDNLTVQRRLAAILNTKGQLFISDEPDRYYVGKVYSAFATDVQDRVGSFSIEFVVEPFAYATLDVNESIYLDDDIFLDSDVTLNNSGNYEYTITGNTTALVNNFGTRPVRPKIIITGSFTTMTINIGGKTLTYATPITNKTLVLDNKEYTATIDNVSVLSGLSGNVDSFLTLQPGDNNVIISGTGLNITVRFEFTGEYY